MARLTGCGCRNASFRYRSSNCEGILLFVSVQVDPRDQSNKLLSCWRYGADCEPNPTVGRSVLAQSTGVRGAATDGCKSLARQRRSHVSIPAEKRAVRANAAGVPQAAADGRKTLTFRRRRCLVSQVLNYAPADSAAVRAQSARVSAAPAYGCEALILRRRLSHKTFVRTPAYESTVSAQSACCITATANCRKSLSLRWRWHRLIAPANRSAVGD